jgi:hypothetical protein
MIQWGLKGVNAEKSDLDALKSKLSNLLLGEKTEEKPEKTQAKESQPEQTEMPQVPGPVSSNLPEPPVIIHVRNPNKQSS